MRPVIELSIRTLADALIAAPNTRFPVGVSLSSYRGHYEELGIGYGAEIHSSRALGAALNDAVATKREFPGWKGEIFVMHGGTQVWLADYGHCSPSPITKWLMPIILKALYP